MKRDFLQGLELSDELIDKIMAEHGKTVADTKAKLTAAEEQVSTLTSDLSAANETITGLQKSNTDNADLQKQIEDYQAKLTELDNQRQADRKNAFIELGLTKAGVKNNKAVSALLDLEKISEGESGWTGLDEQLTALKESDSYLFATQEQSEPQPKFTAAGNPPVENETGGITKEQFDRMGVKSRNELFERDPELYKKLRG